MLATKKSDCKMQTGFSQIGKIGECGCWTGEPQDLAQNDAQQLPLPVSANRIESFHQQLEQPRICHQELKEQAAQTIRLYEPDELIQSCIRISRLCQPFD